MYSVIYICSAEAETKAKLDKVAEIKKITTQMMGIKSEISKYEELLKEYQLYKKFLDDVSPEVCSLILTSRFLFSFSFFFRHYSENISLLK